MKFSWAASRMGTVSRQDAQRIMAKLRKVVASRSRKADKEDVLTRPRDLGLGPDAKSVFMKLQDMFGDDPEAKKAIENLKKTLEGKPGGGQGGGGEKTGGGQGGADAMKGAREAIKKLLPELKKVSSPEEAMVLWKKSDAELKKLVVPMIGPGKDKSDESVKALDGAWDHWSNNLLFIGRMKKWDESAEDSKKEIVDAFEKAVGGKMGKAASIASRVAARWLRAGTDTRVV